MGESFQKLHRLHEEIWPRCTTECQTISVKLTSIDTACVISSPNPMFDHLLESSHWDDSNKCSNIEFGEEIGIIGIEIHTLSGALIPRLVSAPMYRMHATMSVCNSLQT